MQKQSMTLLNLFKLIYLFHEKNKKKKIVEHDSRLFKEKQKIVIIMADEQRRGQSNKASEARQHPLKASTFTAFK